MSHRNCDSGSCGDCEADYDDYLWQKKQEEEEAAKRWRYELEEKAFIEGAYTKQQFLDFLLAWLDGDNLKALEFLKAAENAKKEKIQAELPRHGLD